MRNFYVLILLVTFVFTGCVNKPQHKSGELNLGAMFCAVGSQNVLQDSTYFTWGASAIKGDDGKYHLFYARWKREYGFMAWASHSEIAHAVSDSLCGEYKFRDVALPARGQDFWDGICTHNPTIHRFGKKYYLYYTGNTGDGEIMPNNGLNYTHRNNQRIGVAVSTNLFGQWQRSDTPLIDVSADSSAHDALVVNNPSITKTAQGKYLMVYKAVAKKNPMPHGGPVVHLSAVSDRPDGGFVKLNTPIFTAENSNFPAEDPFIWYSDNDKCYYAIVKDMHGAFTNAGRSLILFYSIDGLDWKSAKHTLVSDLSITWNDGRREKVLHLERPQLYIENGELKALFLAADRDLTQSFNIHVPLR